LIRHSGFVIRICRALILVSFTAMINRPPMQRLPDLPAGADVRVERDASRGVLRIALPRHGFRTGRLIAAIAIAWMLVMLGDWWLLQSTGRWIAAMFVAFFACVCAAAAMFAQVLHDEPVMIELTPQALRVAGGESASDASTTGAAQTWPRDQIAEVRYDPVASAVLIRSADGAVVALAPNRDPRVLAWIGQVLSSELQNA
jgi:hypothetical protein